MKDFPEFFGIATVGARGQIVIPSGARKSLKIKSGDKLIVTSGHPGQKTISLIPADDFARFLNKFEKHISTLKAGISKKRKDGKNI